MKAQRSRNPHLAGEPREPAQRVLNTPFPSLDGGRACATPAARLRSVGARSFFAVPALSQTSVRTSRRWQKPPIKNVLPQATPLHRLLRERGSDFTHTPPSGRTRRADVSLGRRHRPRAGSRPAPLPTVGRPVEAPPANRPCGGDSCGGSGSCGRRRRCCSCCRSSGSGSPPPALRPEPWTWAAAALRGAAPRPRGAPGACGCPRCRAPTRSAATSCSCWRRRGRNGGISRGTGRRRSRRRPSITSSTSPGMCR